MMGSYSLSWIVGSAALFVSGVHSFFSLIFSQPPGSCCIFMVVVCLFLGVNIIRVVMNKPILFIMRLNKVDINDINLKWVFVHVRVFEERAHLLLG